MTHAKRFETDSPTVSVRRSDGKTYSRPTRSGDGQFDAFMNACEKGIRSAYEQNNCPTLIDYAVRIPPGSNSDALCETIITWQQGKKEFITRGLDSDQTVSAITATQKMLNILEM